MNYLSHYYFDRFNPVAAEVLGAVLPDMLRSFNKDWVLHTDNNEALITASQGGSSLLKGWRKHKLIDRLFHSGDSFKRETALLKPVIRPILTGSPIWAFFLAHIFYELNLDAVLLSHNLVDANRFYETLVEAGKKDLTLFLVACGISDPESFFPWLDRFTESRFLSSYRKPEGIAYALDRVCYRLWHEPLSDEQKSALSTLCIAYQEHLEPLYTDLLTEISRGISVG